MEIYFRIPTSSLISLKYYGYLAKGGCCTKIQMLQKEYSGPNTKEAKECLEKKKNRQEIINSGKYHPDTKNYKHHHLGAFRTSHSLCKLIDKANSQNNFDQ
ncbi:12960_t:CDS:2 [Entrophospora sp. SA101]|nr:12960_t:CDS:2 [Entrophospora sp. SA101]